MQVLMLVRTLMMRDATTRHSLSELICQLGCVHVFSYWWSVPACHRHRVALLIFIPA